MQPFFRPRFLILGKPAEGLKRLLTAIEDLFFIEFVHSGDVGDLSKSKLDGAIAVSASLEREEMEFLHQDSLSLPILYTESDSKALRELLVSFGVTFSDIANSTDHYLVVDRNPAWGCLARQQLGECRTSRFFPLRKDSGVVPLIEGAHSIVYGVKGSSFVTTIPLPREEVKFLGNVFSDQEFMSLLPLFHFLRYVLNERFFRQVCARACVVFDDPNLRMKRYGFMNYHQMVAMAREHHVHLAIGMIPIDYKKIGRSAMDIFRHNSDVISVLIHGVQHNLGEFSIHRSAEEWDTYLRAALNKVQDFERRTDLTWHRSMVAPHEIFTSQVIPHFQTAGFNALLCQSMSVLPPLGNGKLTMAMYPAELSFGGFPILDRLSMEYHYYREQRPYWKNSFLLNDWLGKPAIPWSHHYIFRKGTSYFEEILHFINSTINPEWSNITRVLEKNYMVAMREGTMCVNLFSNMSRIDLGDYQGDVIISKFCDGLASNDSKLYINGDEIAWDVSSPFLLSLLYQPKQKRFLDVCIRPVTSEINASQGTFSIIARIRRLLVEARDQMTPFLQVGRFPPTYGPID